MENKRCGNCKYMRKTEEYWHDHYLIPSHDICIYKGYGFAKDIDIDGCCDNHEYAEWFLDETKK